MLREQLNTTKELPVGTEVLASGSDALAQRYNYSEDELQSFGGFESARLLNIAPKGQFEQLNEESGGLVVEYVGMENAILLEGIQLTQEELRILGLEGIDPSKIRLNILDNNQGSNYPKYLALESAKSEHVKEMRLKFISLVAISLLGQKYDHAPHNPITAVKKGFNKMADIFRNLRILDDEPLESEDEPVEEEQIPLTPHMVELRNKVEQEIAEKGVANISVLYSHMLTGESLVKAHASVLSSNGGLTPFEVITETGERLPPSTWTIVLYNPELKQEMQFTIDYANLTISSATMEESDPALSNLYNFESAEQIANFIQELTTNENIMSVAEPIARKGQSLLVQSSEELELAVEYLSNVTDSRIILGAHCNPSHGGVPVTIRSLPENAIYFAPQDFFGNIKRSNRPWRTQETVATMSRNCYMAKNTNKFMEYSFHTPESKAKDGVIDIEP